MYKKFFTITALIISLIFIISFILSKRAGKQIVLGQSAPLTGPLKMFGEDIVVGARAYFNYVNDNSILDKKIKLITLDDKYEPKLTLLNVNKLISKYQVFSLFGIVGTPTSAKVLPKVIESEIPLIATFSGASFLRERLYRNIINIRSSYKKESEALINYLTNDLKMKKIAIFYQNDSYGKNVLSSVREALQKKDIYLVAEGTYKRNTLSISHALYEIEAKEPDAIIMVGSYKSVAKFIKRAKKGVLKDAIFCNVSFVGSRALLEELNYNMKNIVISQVLPPFKYLENLYSEYLTLLERYYPHKKPSFVSFEAFISAKLTVKALLDMKYQTQEEFIKAFESIESDYLIDLNISLSKENHNAIDSVFLTEYVENEFRLIKEIK